MTTVATRNRPSDESRLQIRYGSEASWLTDDHFVAHDPARIDTTMILGCNLDDGVIVALDPATYDPLPMGISIEIKQADLAAARKHGWTVLTRENQPGRRRQTPRARERLETVVITRPERLVDLARFERRSADLRLDPALRYSAASALAIAQASDAATLHELERQFDLTSEEILDIIGDRTRLAVAVRGGVAEHHLEKLLRLDPGVSEVARLDVDKMHDFDVTLRDGRMLRVECKNASPQLYADGSPKVEVQKTRATQGDRAGRLYRVDQFDVVAACLFASTGNWTFKYKATSQLTHSPEFDDRLAALQRVDSSWSDSVGAAVGVSGPAEI